MSQENAFPIVVIGGSAGALSPLLTLLHAQCNPLPYALLIVLHRMRNVPSALKDILDAETPFTVVEPEDKDEIKKGHIYLAPQNYHLLTESEGRFSLEYSEPVAYSRPSIDVTMETAAWAFEERVIGIILSGANNDGTAGLKAILDAGGKAYIQAPETAQYDTMPADALASNPGASALSVEEIGAVLCLL
jgi:two-component system chemotaxis response regulator CheB